MRRLAILALLAGCNNDTTIAQVSREIAVLPGLLDAGEVRVGEALSLDLSVSHLAGGEVTISGLDVRNVDGEFFAFDGAVPIVIPVDGLVPIAIQYTPVTEGYHRAVVTIVSDAGEGTVEVDVRAHAVSPVPYAYPSVIDFGAVPDGGNTEETVFIGYHGTVALDITEASCSDASFTVQSTLPVEVAPGSEVALRERFFADGEASTAGTPSLGLSGGSLLNQSSFDASPAAAVRLGL